MKHQVPVRTFTDWQEDRPGFFEADLVAHCGSQAAGAFLHTLVLTDVATGWTECLPLLFRTQEAVVQAVERIRQLLPFPLLGLDTDNGSEFLNTKLLAYCEQEQITFTRSRAYKKNDQCFVEQKNGVIVRQLVGYDRYEGPHAYAQLTELYRAVRLYVNFFQPSMKLLVKHRDGAKVTRKYDLAQTPHQRVVSAGVLDAAAAREQLAAFYQALDPVRLRQQLETLQDAVWRHACVGQLDGEGTAPTPLTPRAFAYAEVLAGAVVPPELGPAGEPAGGTDSAGAVPEPGRKYRRSGKPRAPRTWRTRVDPFAEVWSEVTEWLAVAPERTAKDMFAEVQQRYPGTYTDGQLRTLQRRVKEWRQQALLQFDTAWLDEELQVGRVHPGPLRGTLTPAEPMPPDLVGVGI